MENIIIRELQAEDADAIAHIFGAITQKPVADDFRQLIQTHARREKDICFVAELEGEVMGFIISYILTLGFGIEESAWIATMGINPKLMGQGIGASLAKAVFSYYKEYGITKVYTSVRWDSTDMLSFFKTLGFDRSNFINLHKSLS